jgi:O-succinylbenzoate synthase
MLFHGMNKQSGLLVDMKCQKSGVGCWRVRPVPGLKRLALTEAHVQGQCWLRLEQGNWICPRTPSSW